MTMESRKVQLTGGSTFTVSLPKPWAREHGVDAGSELLLRANGDGTLVVQVDPDSTDERTTVDVDALAEHPLDRVVRAMYVAGHDEFVLAGERAARSLAAVESAAADLVGLAVAETDDGAVVLRNALDSGDVSVPQTLLQLERTASGAYHDAVAVALGGGAEPVDVRERAADADRLLAVVGRSFRRSLTDLREVDRLELDRPDLFVRYRTARTLGRVADHADRLAAVDTDGDASPDELAVPLESLATDATALLTDATTAILEGDGSGSATDLASRGADLQARADDVGRRLREADVGYGTSPALVHRHTTAVVDLVATLGTVSLRGVVPARE